ncbi:hypothetical protein BZG36_00502 [Bifiguratus adelaidae]|uniref:Kinetochore protein SPC25 n=1 Tax=Bifiguratus adelaidae TaxID=1938954 RepID=A0A261Y7E8_9FUNG|nr:hypothetical protein BZG36_00502 [Bifiguratus adelaidae]
MTMDVDMPLAFREPTISATFTSGSMAYSLPTMDFGAQDLKQRMEALSIKFDEYIKLGRETITQRRENWLKALAENKERQTKMERDLELYKAEEQVLTTTIAKEKQEIYDAENTIKQFTSHSKMMQEKINELQKQADSLRREVNNKRQAKIDSAKASERQKSKNEPELRAFQTWLSFKIEGGGSDKLAFTFTHIDPNDWNREFTFVLDVGQRIYQVPKCQPMVSNLAQLLNELNEKREYSDFINFIKYMRKAFKETL